MIGRTMVTTTRYADQASAKLLKHPSIILVSSRVWHTDPFLGADEALLEVAP